MAASSVPVRITRKRYEALKKEAKKNGHTLSWLLNLSIDLYFQQNELEAAVARPVAVQKEQTV